MSLRFANPIYDSVFKRLMEDNDIARGILSRLLEMDVVELLPKRQEYSFLADAEMYGDGEGEAVPGDHASADHAPPRQPPPLAPRLSVRVFRIDFSAVVRLGDGRKRNVIIELQKSHLLADLVRFRRYLGQIYASEADRHDVEVARVEAKNRTLPPEDELPPPQPPDPLPVLPIFLLDFVVGANLPRVIRVKRRCHDGVTKAALDAPMDNPFIESLTHDAVVVQFPVPPRVLASGEEETELERLLHIFERRYRFDDEQRWYINGAALEPVAEHDLLVRSILRNLAISASDIATRNSMTAEDDIVKLLAQKESVRRALEKNLHQAEELIEEERRQKEEERRQKEEERLLKEDALRHADAERREKEEAKQEIERLKAKLAHLQERTDSE